jgi:stringent starvation protein B
VARKISVPIEQVSAIYSRENGAGMAFDVNPEAELGDGSGIDAMSDDAPPEPEPPKPEPTRPKLQRIK